MVKMHEDYIKVVKIRMVLRWLFSFVIPLLPMTLILGIWVLPMLESIGGLDYIRVMFWVVLIILIATPIIAFLIGSWWARKWYNNFDYELEDEGLKIHSGVWHKVRKLIPYEKIQNLAITQGIWERRYGLSNLLIETAGYGGALWPEGIIPGLKEPEPIMDELRARMKK